MDCTPELPGSQGEHKLQHLAGSEVRAARFYRQQVLDHLNDTMQEFVSRQELLFIATSDARGECDSSLRAGPPGFIQVLDATTVAYPEYRGNGVMASLGNLQENPHVGLLMIDFFRDVIGLHVNGRAQVVPDADMRLAFSLPPADPHPGRKAQLWVLVDVAEAYIHCSKHIPLLQKLPKEQYWGTDDFRRKGGDFFGARSSPSPWSEDETSAVASG
jgi:predicted pyridoxine 5'-phosphate oxidase superfamily flavin-nucleotide-binding protein